MRLRAAALFEIAALFAITAPAAPALAGDLILIDDARALGVPRTSDPPAADDFAASNLTIVEENLDAIVYRIAGVPERQTIARAEVRRVHHDPSTVPRGLADGLSLAAARRFDAARERFASVARDAAAPAWAQAEAAFRAAESYAAAGDAAAAERALGAFVQERPKSRWVLDARLARARALASLSRDADAKAEYAAVASTKGVADDDAAAARFSAAWIDVRAALRAGDAALAAASVKSLDDLRGRASGVAGERFAAARAACLFASGRDDDARAALTPLVAASEDAFALAVGHTVLGESALRRAAADRALLEEAQEHFLRVVLLYASAPDAADLVDESQFRAGELFVKLAPADAAGAAEAKARARREWEELVRRAAAGEWAKRAKAALAELQ